MHETKTVILAHCLMPNHFHLAVKVSTVPLGRVIQRILTAYVKTFNFRHDRTGHLFEARHKAKICLTDRYLLGLIRYIQMNPVRAKLVKNAADWPWSSRNPMSLPDIDTDSFEPWPKDAVPLTLTRPEVEVESTLDEIAVEVAAAAGINLGSMRLKVKRRDYVKARIRFAQEGVRLGHRIGAIAAWLDISTESVSYYLRTNLTNPEA